MKIVLISAYFFPESVGGTERYVFDLAKTLQHQGHQVDVISAAKEQTDFTYENIKVHGLKDDNLNAFNGLLKMLQGDVAHFHTLTPTFDIAHMKLAQKSGYRVFFTSHIPGNTCIRGSLVRYGRSSCDGKLREKTCLNCYISGKGFPIPIAKTMGYFIRNIGFPASLAHVVGLKKHQLKQINEICEAVFVFSNWQQKTFTENGVIMQKTHVISHTWPHYDQQNITFHSAEKIDILTVGFAGRISPEKGLHILIDAFLLLPKEGFKLHIAGIVTTNNAAYYEKLKTKTAGLSNINWSLNRDEKQMAVFMQQIDVLCIPSQLFETGPYVLFEALAQQTPVIAGNMGGMKEWAEKGFPVTLFTHDDAHELAQTILRWEPSGQKIPMPVPDASAIHASILKIYQQKQPLL